MKYEFRCDLCDLHYYYFPYHVIDRQGAIKYFCARCLKDSIKNGSICTSEDEDGNYYLLARSRPMEWIKV